MGSHHHRPQVSGGHGLGHGRRGRLAKVRGRVGLPGKQPDRQKQHRHGKRGDALPLGSRPEGLVVVFDFAVGVLEFGVLRPGRFRQPQLGLAQVPEFRNIAENGNHADALHLAVPDRLEIRGGHRQGDGPVAGPNLHHALVFDIGLIDGIHQGLQKGVQALKGHKDFGQDMIEHLGASQPEYLGGRGVEGQNPPVQADRHDPAVHIVQDVFIDNDILVHQSSILVMSIFQVSRVVPRVRSNAVRALR